MQQIETNIYYEDAFLGATLGALVFNHGVIMIDAPLRPEDTRTWRSALVAQRGGANRLLVSLDSHPDRTLGTRPLECPIVAHQLAAQVFRNRPMIFKGQTVETGSAWETYNEAVGMRWSPPDITFTEQMWLHWGGPDVSLMWRPGPTPGSIWAVIPAAKVVFVGDCVIVGQPPFLSQADLPQWIANLDLLLTEYNDYKIVSGRGGLAGLDDIQTLRSLLAEIAQHIEDLGDQNAAPEATAPMASDILKRYTIPAKLHDYYLARLTFGLQQTFIRRFRPAAVISPVEVEEEEQ